MTARRTKIVATLGPSTSTPASMRAVIDAGVDVVRINAAHGDAAGHSAAALLAQKVAGEIGRPIGVLVDLPGPKMRTGPIAGDSVRIEAGDPFTLFARPVDGDAAGASTTVAGLGTMVRPGDPIVLADGQIRLRVLGLDGDDVQTEVVRGGRLSSRKGIFLPEAEHQVEPFTAADADALATAMAIRADFVGLSFVRGAEDVERVRALLPRRGYRPKLMAKIETRRALDHLPALIRASDAVMVARGDLGIQIDVSQVPLVQKEIIHACNVAGRPVVTATEMLESMTTSPIPTRAEAGDIANAVIDGTDALMLSAETATGAYAADAVDTMARVALAAETWPRVRVFPDVEGIHVDRVAWAVAHAAVEAAQDLGVAAILCPTRTGATARRVAAFRPSVPVAGLSQRRHVRAGLALVWGVVPLALPGAPVPSHEIYQAVEVARSAGLVATGDLVVVVAGAPGPRAGGTDTMRVLRV
jgi:pyruvate kinase